MEDHVFDTVDIILEDIDSYIEERRWDETSNGGEARDKNFDIVMARSMRMILPQVEHISVCKKNPSIAYKFKYETGKCIGEIAAVLFLFFSIFYVAYTILGIPEIIKSAIP